MTCVFISGSRAINRLNNEIRQRLGNLTNQGFDIVLGDANGADKAVQKWLLEQEYPKVTVYCSGDSCRNNLGQWPVKTVEVSRSLRGRDFYTQKDKAMAQVADYGLVLWDGKSQGSCNNLKELLRQNKKALVYYSPRKQFTRVATQEDLHGLLNHHFPRANYDQGALAI